MAQSAFALHLGGGLYLDSDGTLTQGAPPPGTPVYQTPFKLPIDPKKARDAMEGVQKALKDINKDPAVLKKFADFGFDTGILDVLSGVAKIAGVVAPVLAVVAIVYDLLKLFGLFKDGPSALEELVKQRFDELESNVESIKVLIEIKDLRDHRVAIETFVAEVRSYVQQLQNATPSIAQLELDRNRLLALHSLKAPAVAALLDTTSWIGNFDRDEHTRVWPWLQHHLHAFPGSVGAPAVKVPFPGDGSLQFDHRLMVPLACYAAESYLASIRGIVPEHRSTGEFRDSLRLLANKMDDLAQAMRTQGLARTLYRTEDFAFPVQLAPHDTVLTGSFPFLGVAIAPTCNRWPVGAMDLRYHDDRFFAAFLDGLFRAEFFGYPHPTKRGGVNFRWIPPAKLETAAFGNYRITNPEECAAAANAQAEKDYADLLSVSGYTELVRLAALLRSESTEPDRSQTVAAAKPALYRDALPEVAVTVQSEPIFMTGVISSPAKRESQRCMASLRVGTQPIKRARPAEYSIKLRTLRSINPGKRWQEPSYADFHRPHYETDLSDQRFLRMAIFQSDLALDQTQLIAGSSPQGDALHAEGTASIKADTFDWWIPVKAPFDIATRFDVSMLELRAFGWSAPGALPMIAPAPPPMQTLSHDNMLIPATLLFSDYRDLLPELLWKSGEQDWDGQHRDPLQKQITVKYRLDWSGDRLQVWLENDPLDRNYVVYVVIEEKLLGSGQILHTAMPVPINGQLTYVPQKFFDDEFAAIARAAGTISEFNRKYSEQREPGPIDPVVGWLRPGDLVSRDSIERFVALARQHEPQLLDAVMAEIINPEPVAAA